MKDKPLAPQAPSGSIPLISPILHCVAMPVLVFMRYNFGYSYLRPKKIFLASIMVTAGFAFAVWHDPVLAAWRPLAVFAVLASSLYLLHLVSGVIRLTSGEAEHDQYSGTSLLLLFVSKKKHRESEGLIHCLVEPLVTAGVGYFISALLGKIFLACGIALGLKELIRAWLSLRSDKVLADNLADAKDKMGSTQTEAHRRSLSAKGRTPREHYAANSAED